MRMRLRKTALLLSAITAVFMAVGAVAAEPSGVITLGADLEPDQRESILRVFGFTAEEAAEAGVSILTVTNAEEQDLLGDFLPDESIGSYAVSSAYVQPLTTGSGITVERYNITYVTDLMYANALVTAGVRDARVMVAAPVAVSGTAALTGILKAFEQATGKDLADGAKTTAGQELAATGQLGAELGDRDQAAQLVAQVKEQVLNRQPADREAVRDIVLQVAGDLNIRLSDAQVERIAEVAGKVKELDLRAQDLRTQIRDLGETLNQVKEQDTRNLLQRIIDFIARLISRFISTLVNLVPMG